MRPRPPLPLCLFLATSLVATAGAGSLLAGCALTPDSPPPPASTSSRAPRVNVVPAQVKEPPGPTDASGMGATATPSPTAPAARRGAAGDVTPPASAPAPAPSR